MISSLARAANVWMELFAAVNLGLSGRFDTRFALAAQPIFEKSRVQSIWHCFAQYARRAARGGIGTLPLHQIESSNRDKRS